MPTHRFTHRTPYPIDRVWDWFDRPGALHRLSPPWMSLQPAAEVDNIRDGQARLAVAPYGVRLPFVPTWLAQHQAPGYVEGRHFVDVAESQPYAALTGWRHEHGFEPDGADATLVQDAVTARVPRRMLAPVFAYRSKQIDADLAAHERYPARLTVAVTGASGLIGSQLTAFLSTGGHRVIELLRAPRPSVYETRVWDVDAPDPSLLDGVDVVVHLAGEPVLGRFDEEHLRKVRDSRVGPTRALAEAAAAAHAASGRPVTFVCASAVGYYGIERGDEELTEDSGRGTGALADVVEQWEAATAPAADGGLRVVNLRIASLVLSARGGALAALRPVFTAGVGGRLGDGRQWMSWIALDDLLEIFLHAMTDERIEGPVNAVAPEPVRNAEFTRTMGRVLHRPTVLPTPAFGPRLLFGEQGYREMLLASHRELPAKLQAVGHHYRFPTLQACLEHELGRG